MAAISPDIIRNPYVGTNGNWYVWDSSAYNFVDTGIPATGNDGSVTYSGTVMTGTSTSPTIFSGSGITYANTNDRYRNTDSGSGSYQNEYKCVTAGDAATAEWVYDGNVRGASGAGSGDMVAATYDPTSVGGDAFDMDNMEQGDTNKFVSAAEKTVIENTSGTNTGDETPSDDNPLMNGTAAPGTSDNYSRKDHVHPSDTTKQALVSSPTDGHIVTTDENGQGMDSGIAANAPTGIYYVSPNGSDSLSGKSQHEAKQTIQAAIDAASSNGIVLVGAGTYTLTSALKMRAGVKIVGSNAIITQGNSQNLTMLIDFATYSAHGASLSGFTIDGNRANNMDNDNSFSVYVGIANDVSIFDDIICNSTGYGIFVGYGGAPTYGMRCKIYNNSIYNVRTLGIGTVTGGKHIIRNNVLTSPLGQHAISVTLSSDNIVISNIIDGILVGGVENPMTVNTTGTTVTWASGPDFEDVEPGMFLIMNNGTEYHITAKASDTSLTVNTTPGEVSGGDACIGEGDLISIGSIEDSIVSNNITNGGVTGGIIISNSLSGDCDNNIFIGNKLKNCGGAGIGTMSYNNTYHVGYNSYIGNHIHNCALSGNAGPGSAHNGPMVFISGTYIYKCLVDGNYIYDGKVTPSATYWLILDGIANGQIRVGNNTAYGMVNSGIGGGIASISLSGWGTGATTSDIISHGNRFRFTITAGSSPSGNPSFTVNMPACMSDKSDIWNCKHVGGTGSLARIYGENYSADGGSVTAVYEGTPVEGNTYIIFGIC